MPTIKTRKYKDSVYIIYSHKLNIFKIYTGAKIDDQYWHADAPRKNCPDYDGVIARVAEVKSRVLNASLAVRSRGMDPTADLVRKEYYNQLQPKEQQMSFWGSYKTYLNLLTCRESTKKKVRITHNVLEYFCQHDHYEAHPDTFDKIVFGRFILYLLTNQKMADSTIHRHVKALKAFFKFTYPEKDISFMKYTMLTADEEIIALNDDELSKLIEADLTGYLDTTRDLFVFCSTTGMRYSDSQAFNSSWVTQEQILEFKQVKTGGKAMPPLYEVARRILDKYNGSLPKISNQKFNKFIKILFVELALNRPVNTHIVRGKVVYSDVKPLSLVITSHAARRTFISLCLQKGMPLIDVMKMSGHSDFRSMKPYIQVTRKHLRDVADKWDI